MNSERKKRIDKWQEKLEITFSGPTGVVGERLMEVINGEKQYRDFVIKKYHGHRVLSDSFFDYYMETLKLAANWWSKKGPPKSTRNYSMLFFRHITTFRNLRAAENLFITGYPLDGYALLRNIKDQAIFIGALVNGYTSLNALWGYPEKASRSRVQPGDINILPKKSIEEFNATRKKAQKEEKKIFNLMIRKDSGLSEKNLNLLSLWEDMFNLEVHGSRFTYAFEMFGWFTRTKSPSIAPKPEERSMSMYMNRVSEIEWLIMRTFPFLQLESAAFGGQWADKWKVLNESFYFMVESLGSQAKKEIAYAIIALVENKFNFSPNLVYLEN